ncbi:hypothetical protein P389DRAFT_13752 [Cystobasidium minutum MCA 4210]|uniref:uncharacterized protein n=1 Tax=Cystobasidium minutum MCA 4210 TaxID=1397322 RepID=UPI0034CF531B|eukprot:jgi/Rhomi1/13752/CE13751_60
MSFVESMKRPSTSIATSATPSSSRSRLGTPLSSRPSTAVTAYESNRIVSPATLFKPLPALPTPKCPKPQQQREEAFTPAIPVNPRPGFLSVQTSPRKATFSRPGTASPAARSFGLVAPYANLSPTYRDYRSLKSRESFSSLLEGGNKGSSSSSSSGNARSRSVSVSSHASVGMGKKSKAGSEEGTEKPVGPPRYISFAIDQETFREICPIFELVETVHHPAKALNSSSSSSCPSTLADEGVVHRTPSPMIIAYRYLPIHTDQAYPFHHAALEAPPILRRLLVDKYEKFEFMNKQSVLPIKNEGIYAVKGTSSKGDHTWRFEYRVTDRLNLLGKPIPGEKVSSSKDT